jgi:hypothetical protein
MNGIVDANPWSSETLLAKAQLYTEQMEHTVADDWRYGLWSALSLELLSRAALANISPILLADAKNWQNLLHALGRAPTAKLFSPTSISTREVLARLTELVPEFTKEVAGFCSQHIDRRNTELHSGESAFSGLGTSEWLPRYYKACKILLEAMGKDLSCFAAASDKAEEMVNSLADEAAKAVQKEINAHAKVWQGKPDQERDTALLQARSWATRHAGHRVVCPACQSPALLQGSPSGSVSTTIGDDEVIQRQTLLPTAFECIACGLKIAGYSKLSACGLGDAFTETSVYTAAEFFELYTEEDLEEARAGMPEYEPDFNEY